MSMFATFPYEDRIEMLTDGANYTKRGTVVLATEKVWRSPDCPMFVTGRGNTRMIRDLAKACMALAAVHGSFGKTIKAIEIHLDHWRETHGSYTGKFFQLLIAGWDAEFGFAQFHVASHADWIPGMEPMRVNTVWSVFYAGPPIDEERAKPLLTKERVEAGAAIFGPEFCQLARETPMQQADNPELTFPSVGCHIDLTTLTSTGVETKRLMTWPDRRFHKIDVSLKPTILLEAVPHNTAINPAPPRWVQPIAA